MNKTNLSNWLSGLSAILMVVLLVSQRQQSRQIEKLEQQQTASAQKAEQQQKEQGSERETNFREMRQQLHDLVRLAQKAEQQQKEQRSERETNFREMRQQLHDLVGLAQKAEQQQKEQRSEREANFREMSQQLHDLVGLAQKAEQQQKEQRSEREANFREMRQQLDDLVSSGALFPNKSKPAGEALALAKAAEKAGNRDLAKIYYLSAVNHAPSEFSILNDYAKFVLSDRSATTKDFSQLRSVLQISLYQISPGSITNAVDLLKQAESREEQLLAAQTPKPVNWQERFEQISKTDTLDASWSDLKRLSRRWEELKEIAESLRDEQPDTDFAKRVERELELTLRVLSVARLATALDTMMGVLKSSSEQPKKAVSLLQAVEATHVELWGIDSSGFPAELRSKIDQYPEEIQRHVEAIAEVKSRPFIAKVEAERDSAKAYVANKMRTDSSVKGGPIQKVIEHRNHCLDRAISAAQQISFVDGRQKAEDAIKEIRGLVRDAQQNQFDEYQKWVVGLCKTTFTQYQNNWKLNLPKTNDTARDIFTRSRLATVDLSLLAPETSGLFRDVFEKLIAKMNGEGQFLTQKEIAETKKKKLEDF
jgi:myosin heavy subunit